MDDWKLEDPKTLEFDFNECTPREFREVFAMSPALARNLYEYRTEVVCVLNLKKLLKLKEVTEETLEKWCHPQVDQKSFDAEFQKDLGLQTQSAEPLPSLLQAICKKTEAIASLMVSRKGNPLLKTSEKDGTTESLTPIVTQMVAPVQENVAQMELGIADLQIIGFQAHDLLFLPVSGFYLAALFANGKATPETQKLWQRLAAEIRRRHPPKIFINTNASVTESDIAFDCPHCSLRIVVDQSAAGYDFPCPSCKASVKVPESSTV